MDAGEKMVHCPLLALCTTRWCMHIPGSHLALITLFGGQPFIEYRDSHCWSSSGHRYIVMNSILLVWSHGADHLWLKGPWNRKHCGEASLIQQWNLRSLCGTALSPFLQSMPWDLMEGSLWTGVLRLKRNVARPMFGARPVAHSLVWMWVHSSFSEGRDSLESGPFTSMLVKDSSLQRFLLSSLLPLYYSGFLSPQSSEPALPQEGQ